MKQYKITQFCMGQSRYGVEPCTYMMAETEDGREVYAEIDPIGQFINGEWTPDDDAEEAALIAEIEAKIKNRDWDD